MDNQQAKDPKLIWLAGFLDGEGSFSLIQSARGKKRYFVPRVAVCNTDTATLEYVRCLLRHHGIGHHVEDRTVPGFNKKPYWQLRIAGAKRLNTFLPLILPFLVTKRFQASAVLDWCRSRLERPVRSPYNVRELSCYDIVKRMNGRGLASETTRRTAGTPMV